MHLEKCCQHVEGGDCPLLLSTGEVTSAALQYKRDISIVETVQYGAMKMVKGWEYLFFGERLRKLEPLSFEKRKLWGDHP